MGEHARDEFPPEELLNSFACLDPSSIQEMEGGQVVNVDYQELCSYPSTTSLPTMAESLTDYISYYSKMEIVNSCGIDLSKPTQQSRGVEHPQRDSIDFNDNVSQNKEITDICKANDWNLTGIAHYANRPVSNLFSLHLPRVISIKM